MNDSSNSRPCSNNDHVDRLDFLENEKEETFMFEPINLTSKKHFPNVLCMKHMLLLFTP
jgi:hypothetical protein